MLSSLYGPTLAISPTLYDYTSPTRKISTITFSFLAVGLAVPAYLVGSLYPPPVLSIINPPVAPPSPAAGSPEGKAAVEAVEHGIQNLDEVKRLRGTGEWVESRPYRAYPEERRVHSLTAGTLRNPGGFAVAPLVFTRPDDSEAIIFLHVGRSMCGHDGIVHGGLLATVCDEGLARVALLNLPSKGLGVTATLSVSYRNPTFASQYIVFRGQLDPKSPPSGRKCRVKGKIEDLQGKVLVEAQALFVQPRGASLLSASGVKQALDIKD